MTKQELLGLVDKLANKFAGAGVTNPVSYIEQISFLFFLKMLEEWDDAGSQAARIASKKFNSIFAGDNERYRWSVWSQIPNNEEMLKFVRDDVLEFMKELQNHEDVKRFFNDVRFMIPDAVTMREVVDIISPINFSQLDADVKGDAYEHLVAKLTTSGRNGQFRTPRHIIRTIVQMVDPKLGQTILDPACGTGGFLLAAYEYIKAQNSEKPEKIKAENGSEYLKGHGDNLGEKDWNRLQRETFWGFDVSPDITKIALMNMILHGLDATNIYRRDSLAGAADKFETETYDVVMTNPPFSSKDIALERLRQSLPIKAKDSTILFLGLLIDSLKPGGTGGVIVNEGVLFGRNNTSIQIRKYILNKTELQAVVSLPQGVFNPYAGVKTSFLIFKKRKSSAHSEASREGVWFYEVENDGYSKSAQRKPIDKNDLPHLLERWHQVKEKGASQSEASAKDWTAERKVIEENDYILSASAYKPGIGGGGEEHRSPKEILEELETLDKELENEKNRIKKLLKS